MKLKRAIRLTYTMLVRHDHGLILGLESDDEAISNKLDGTIQTALNALNGVSLVSHPSDVLTPDDIDISVDNLKARDKRHIIANSEYPEVFLDSVAIRFEAEWSNPASIAEYCGDSGRLQTRDVVQRVCGSYLRSAAQRLAILMSMYLPGLTQCHFSYIFPFDKMATRSSGLSAMFDEAAVFLAAHSVPVTPRGSLIDFLNWAFKLDGYWSGLPASNIASALNFVTHAHHTEFRATAFEDFVWVMAAVEALYCDTSQAISEKLRNRVAAFLPKYSRVFTRKGISSLYSFRSKFVHGTLAVPNRFDYDSDDDDKSYTDEFHTNFRFASALLVKTFHAAFDRKKSALTFKERIA